MSHSRDRDTGDTSEDIAMIAQKAIFTHSLFYPFSANLSYYHCYIYRNERVMLPGDINCLLSHQSSVI